MIRPFVTIYDVAKAYPSPNRTNPSRTLHGVNNNLFAEVIKHSDNILLTLFKYDWCTGRIDRLYSVTVGSQFVICKQSTTSHSTAITELKDGKIVVYEATESKLLIASELDIKGQGHRLQVVKGSESLVALISEHTTLYDVSRGKIERFARLDCAWSIEVSLGGIMIHRGFNSSVFRYKFGDDEVKEMSGTERAEYTGSTWSSRWIV